MKTAFLKFPRRFFPFLPDNRRIAELNQDLLNNQVWQRAVFLHYQQLLNSKQPLPRLEDVGFRVYSQTDEDGLLVFIFSLIGLTNKTCVEVAFGQPDGANTTNLLCNWGWYGLLVDANADQLEQARRFFGTHKDTRLYPPKLIQTWITAENVNNVLENNGVSGEIDLFSLDIDGMDYWIWKSLTVILPRVVVVEFQDMWKADTAVTLAYDPTFKAIDPTIGGASLAAFVRLGNEKGYRLVGCNRLGYNAFFVRNDVGQDILPEVSAADCLNNSRRPENLQERLAKAQNLKWVSV